jgi:hypothetical protein
LVYNFAVASITDCKYNVVVIYNKNIAKLEMSKFNFDKSLDSSLIIQNDYIDTVEEFTFTTGDVVSQYLLITIDLFNSYDVNSSLQLLLNMGEKSPQS